MVLLKRSEFQIVFGVCVSRKKIDGSADKLPRKREETAEQNVKVSFVQFGIAECFQNKTRG